MNETTTGPSKLIDLDNVIKGMIKDSGDTIRNTFIDKQIQKEVEKRVNLLSELFSALLKFKREVEKIKPDIISMDADGKVTSESWSKKAVENRKSSLEKLNKAEKVLEKAIGENDYNQVEQTIKSLSIQANVGDVKEADKKSPFDVSPNAAP